MKKLILIIVLCCIFPVLSIVVYAQEQTEQYTILLSECTTETVTVSFTQSQDSFQSAVLVLASYQEDGRMISCKLKTEFGNTELSIPYHADIGYIKAFVLDSKSFSPIQRTWECTSLSPADPSDSKMLALRINDVPITVAWEDNASVDALKELVQENPLTVSMSRYGGFEQVGSLGSRLPSSDVRTTTTPGDIVLYSSNQIVIFYGSNSWAYTRLGHITDQDAAGMTDLLGNGDVTVTISME